MTAHVEFSPSPDGIVDAVRAALPYTKTSTARLRAMAEALERLDSDGIDGDVVECGVWRGGGIVLARKVSPLRTCWLYDTFDGMTEPGEHDVTRSGETRAVDSYRAKLGVGRKWAKAEVGEVRDNLAQAGVLDLNRLRFVMGPVELTLQSGLVPDKIALLRLDTDWYESTRIELEVLFPQLVRGGVLIVDDYGHWMGARKAVDDYFATLSSGNYARSLQQIDYTAVMMVKT